MSWRDLPKRLLERGTVRRRRAELLWRLQRSAFTRVLKLEKVLLSVPTTSQDMLEQMAVDGHTRAYVRLLQMARSRCRRIERALGRNGV